MPKRLFVCRDEQPLLAAAMNSLLLAVAPARPDQLCGLAACESPVPRRPFWRQRDPNEPIVQVLLGMMIDRGP